MAKTKKKKLTLEEKLELALVPKEEQPYEIPDNWVWVRLDAITSKITDGSHNPPKGCNAGIPMYSAKNIHNDFFDSSFANRYISEEEYCIENKRTRISKYDILLTIVGTIGRCLVVEDDNTKFTLQRSVSVLKPNGVDSYLLMYGLQSNYAQELLNTRAKGTAQKGIYLNALKVFEFPLPPQLEQHRIVKEIKYLLNNIYAAKQLIQEAKESFELRRASILNKAFTGELTAKWRETNSPEPAIKLLEKINGEKLKKWDKDCLKATNEGKRKPKKPVIKPVEETIIPKDEQPYEIPFGWEWVRLGDISVIENGDRSSAYPKNSELVDTGIPFINTKNLNDSILDMSGNIKYITETKFNELRSGKLQNKDIIISLRGSIGKYGVFYADDKFKTGFINAQLAILRFSQYISVDLISQYLKTEVFNEYLQSRVTGSAQPQIGASELLKTEMILIPEKEQLEMFKQLSSLLESENKAKELLEMESQIELIEKSILNKAFRGELGTNDITDEPAIELLKRILAEGD